jgi:hypothetical protein
VPRLAVATRRVIWKSPASAGITLGHLWLTFIVRREKFVVAWGTLNGQKDGVRNMKARLIFLPPFF